MIQANTQSELSRAGDTATQHNQAMEKANMKITFDNEAQKLDLTSSDAYVAAIWIVYDRLRLVWFELSRPADSDQWQQVAHYTVHHPERTAHFDPRDTRRILCLLTGQEAPEMFGASMLHVKELVASGGCQEIFVPVLGPRSLVQEKLKAHPDLVTQCVKGDHGILLLVEVALEKARAATGNRETVDSPTSSASVATDEQFRVLCELGGGTQCGIPGTVQHKGQTIYAAHARLKQKTLLVGGVASAIFELLDGEMTSRDATWEHTPGRRLQISPRDFDELRVGDSCTLTAINHESGLVVTGFAVVPNSFTPSPHTITE